ncbi:MAG TPA: DUF4157 domain-containing protein, partial [Anaerolineales bacterium]|nr:DUF4157 domain-containing protein [Anaerolineales bacterium]
MSSTKIQAERQTKAISATKADRPPAQLDKRGGRERSKMIQRAGDMLASRDANLGAPARARMSAAMQRTVGNSRVSSMVMRMAVPESEGLNGSKKDSQDPGCVVCNLPMRRETLANNESLTESGAAGKEPSRLHGLPVQAKLTVDAPNDEYEQEADQIADRMMRMTEPTAWRPRNEEQANEQPPSVQRQAGEGRQAPEVTPDIEEHIIASRGGGQPLSESERAFAEPRFGMDFSDVRLHTDASAANASKELNAQAFTHGQDIYFGTGSHQPGTPRGQQLLAHELTHVVQQSGNHNILVRKPSKIRIARAILDLTRLDRELRSGSVLTQTQGEIGQATAAGRRMDSPTPDSSLPPVRAEVFRRMPPAASGTASPGGASTGAPTQAPSGPPPERALVVGGIHGDERGTQAIMNRLQASLGSPSAPLRRDFDTIVIPVMNPGGVADRTRENRRGIDLNRNFPGLAGFPAPPGAVPPQQLETAAVRRVVETLQPSRILALHAIGDRNMGGVYADPVEGEARELACRMALRMRGIPTGGGAMSGDINVRGDQLARGVCEARYPGAPPSVTSGQSSLGAWASAPSAIGGRGTTVITHEIPGQAPLPEHGAGRSVDTIMPGIEEFLRDSGGSPSEADALLESAVTDAFLTGRAATAADRRLRETIQDIVSRRFSDLATFYRTVWRPAQPGNVKRRLPRRLTSHSHVRTFREQTDIVAGELRRRGVNRRSSVADIQAAILDILQTR